MLEGTYIKWNWDELEIGIFVAAMRQAERDAN
jgi:hypothetical protein